MNLGASELLLILIVVLLLFGGKRLPELARSIGRGLSEFRRATQEVQREISAPLLDPPAHATPRTPQKTALSDSEQTSVNAHPASQPRISEKPPGSTS